MEALRTGHRDNSVFFLLVLLKNKYPKPKPEQKRTFLFHA